MIFLRGCVEHGVVDTAGWEVCLLSPCTPPPHHGSPHALQPVWPPARRLQNHSTQPAIITGLLYPEPGFRQIVFGPGTGLVLSR